jgi:hypothetical protein
MRAREGNGVGQENGRPVGLWAVRLDSLAVIERHVQVGSGEIDSRRPAGVSKQLLQLILAVETAAVHGGGRRGAFAGENRTKSSQAVTM